MTIPKHMRCIEIREPGAPEVLHLVERPTPQPGHGEVLIKVAAAGVNRPDVLQRLGKYPPPRGASDIPGLEIAGEIVALGEAVNESGLQKQVCALVSGGGYAEYCLASADLALPIPGDLHFDQAAAIPETFFTVWSNVFQRGRLQAGEKFLVHGGGSGIGTTAIQLAKAFGAQVFTTVGDDAKVSACKKLGADLIIHYRQQDFVNEIIKATGGYGVDVILDIVGGDYISRNLELLALDGRLVQIAFLNGAKAEVDFRTIMMKRLLVTGSTLRARPVSEKKHIADELLEKVWPLLTNRTVLPLLDRTFPLAEAAAAHAFMESNRHIGKLVLTVD